MNSVLTEYLMDPPINHKEKWASSKRQKTSGSCGATAAVASAVFANNNSYEELVRIHRAALHTDKRRDLENLIGDYLAPVDRTKPTLEELRGLAIFRDIRIIPLANLDRIENLTCHMYDERDYYVPDFGGVVFTSLLTFGSTVKLDVELEANKTNMTREQVAYLHRLNAIFKKSFIFCDHLKKRPLPSCFFTLFVRDNKICSPMASPGNQFHQLCLEIDKTVSHIHQCKETRYPTSYSSDVWYDTENLKELIALNWITVDHLNRSQALIKAMKDKYKDSAKLLLQVEGIDVNQVLCARKTALHYAIEYGWHEIVELLLKSKEIHISIASFGRCFNGMTPLHYALNTVNTREDQVKMITLLLEIPGIDPTAKDAHQRTALDMARYSEVIELLKQKIASRKSGCTIM